LTRKGGFMMAISMGFGFFLLYYIFLIGGEEMADRNRVSPLIGMWTPNVILLVIGVYLTLNTVRERAPLRFRWPWQKTTVDDASIESS
jgi:lipopolysaccharide export system permease protein